MRTCWRCFNGDDGAVLTHKHEHFLHHHPYHLIRCHTAIEAIKVTYKGVEANKRFRSTSKMFYKKKITPYKSA